MQKSLAALVLAILSTSGLAQSNDDSRADRCRAPILLSDTACSLLMRESRSADQTGRMEQRDDGYFVFVPRRSN